MSGPPSGRSARGRVSLFVIAALGVGILVAGVVLAMIGRRAPSAPPTGVLPAVQPDAAPAAAASEPPDAAPPAPRADAGPVACDDADLAACVAGADRVASVDPAQAASLYERACKGGVVRGCTRLGLATEHGRGVARDPARALQLYRDACDKAKDADGCALLASIYEDGKGVATDTKKAVALYTRACEAGSGIACTGLGVLHTLGQGVPVDGARAVALLDKGCTAGDPVGCLRAGRALQRGIGGAPDPARAEALWARLRSELPARCEAGDGRACGVLGVIRFQGLGGEAEAAAIEQIVLGCDLGYARACSEGAALLVMRQNGGDVARKLVERSCDAGDDVGCALFAKLLVNAGDNARALEIFERACKAGGEAGCAELAGFYDVGGPVTEDDARATKLFAASCAGGSFRGCLGLGSRLGNGQGAKKDERGARAAADKACKIEPSGCWMLARYLATGVGGAPDLAEAKRLYTIACEAGEETACPYKDNPLPPDAGAPAP